MSATGRDVFKLIDGLTSDLSRMQARADELKTMLAAMNLPSEPTGGLCPVPYCGIRHKTKEKLDDHMANVHGGLMVFDHTAEKPA